MKATQRLHDEGQSLWLDNITRDLLDSGTLKQYIDELSVTGLTSNPTIFDHAIKNSSAYDAAIREKMGKAYRAKNSSSSWRSRTSRVRPIYFGRFMNGPTAWTDGFRWKCRPCWLTTRPARSPRPRNCIREPGGRTCSSRFPARRKAARHRRGDLCRQSHQRDTLVLARAISWRRPRHSCAASSGASRPG